MFFRQVQQHSSSLEMLGVGGSSRGAFLLLCLSLSSSLGFSCCSQFTMVEASAGAPSSTITLYQLTPFQTFRSTTLSTSCFVILTQIYTFILISSTCWDFYLFTLEPLAPSTSLPFSFQVACKYKGS